MENNSEQPINQQPIQQQPIVQAPSSGSKFNTILLIIILLVVVGVGAYLLGTKDIFTSKNITTNPTTIPTSIPSPSINPSMSHFNDARLQGMEFDYDPQIWDVKKISPDFTEFKNGSGAYQAPAIQVINRNSQDTLSLKFVPPTGIGGGVHAFRQSDVFIIDNYWSRMRGEFMASTDKNKSCYRYGLKKELKYFSQDKAAKDFADKSCNDLSNGNGEYPGGLTVDECNQIKSGSLIGEVGEPNYTWSFHLKNLTSFNEIYGNMHDDRTYSDNDYPDTTIAISYCGSNPEEADKIVKQLRGI